MAEQIKPQETHIQLIFYFIFFILTGMKVASYFILFFDEKLGIVSYLPDFSTMNI